MNLMVKIPDYFKPIRTRPICQAKISAMWTEPEAIICASNVKPLA
jgi:hypothetical protein